MASNITFRATVFEAYSANKGKPVVKAAPSAQAIVRKVRAAHIVKPTLIGKLWASI